MKVIIAARLSRLAKRQTGIDTQDEDSREWALQHGHEIVATVADRKSGVLAPFDRPKLKPWVTEQDHMALYDAIVVAKHDRLSRADWSDEARIRLWAEEHGKKLILVDQDLQWPPKNSDDRQRWNNAAEQSRREWEATSRRYRRMQKSLRDQGYFVGKKTYGFRIAETGEHKTLVIEEDQAEVIRDMARKYLAGMSLLQIRDWLVEESVPAPQGNQWSSQTVRGILSNPVIAGRLVVHGTTYARVPEIIEPAEFEKIRDKMAGKATRGPKSANPALLTGIIKCEHGHKMYRLKGRTRPSLPDGLYYYCNPDEAPKGQRYLVPLTEIDRLVSEAVREIASFPNYVRKLTPADEHANELADVKASIRELDPEDNDYTEKHSALMAELSRLKSLPTRPAESRWVRDGQTVGQCWDSLDNDGKRAWLAERGWVITVLKTEQGYTLEIRIPDLSSYAAQSQETSEQTATRVAKRLAS